ncbi:PAS domain-containing sensor histidine kinase [Candidatus Accumulibacter phosphatis]|uniref:histidine kinase n=2 Tax=Candidatus Accumulibacter phosphatis TaxID=327160 RepID=A0ABX1TXT1_9PROT|nr:PAS domain-containing sensor histidine kinase [Candidatus Accumulibacter phosphatis]
MSMDDLALLRRQLEEERAARKKAEDLLEETVRELTLANQLLQRYLDAVPCIVVALDTRACIAMINRAGCALLGQPESALLGQPWFEHCLPQPSGKSVLLPCFLQLVSGEGQAQEALSEYPVVDADGQQRLMAWHTGMLTDAAGVIVGTLSSGEEISERKLAEVAIAESRNLLLKVIDTVPARVFWKDTDLRFLGCNRRFAEDAGMPSPDDLIGKDDYQMVWAEQADHYRADDREVMAAGAPRLFFEEQQTTASGETVWLRTSKIPLINDDNETFGVLGVYEDITECRRIEADNRIHLAELTALNGMLIEAQNQMLRSVKMASVGRLAAGVANEIDKPFAFINSNLEALKGHVADLLSVLEAYEKAEPALAGQVAFLAAIEQAKEKAHLAFMQHDILNLISESLDGVQRAKTAVETLKEFSRVDTAEWQLANLEKGLESTLNIVWNEIKYKAKIKKDYAGIPDIECLAPQLNQVFLNLVINAAQAIDERGVIILRTGFDEHEVWVEVGDTGKGIEPEDMDKIFDPFFTTKATGKGSGLGLSLADNIVRRHGGRLDTRSKPGKGSVFRVTLPRNRLLNKEDF